MEACIAPMTSPEHGAGRLIARQHSFLMGQQCLQSHLAHPSEGHPSKPPHVGQADILPEQHKGAAQTAVTRL